MSSFWFICIHWIGMIAFKKIKVSNILINVYKVVISGLKS